MRMLTLILLLSVFTYSFGQSSKTNVPVIIDGQILQSDKIVPSDFLERSVIKGESLNQIYSEKKPDSIIVIITKHFAIAQYQKKLSSFSKKYKDYVEWQMKYNHNDNGIFYVILKNGYPKFFSGDDLIRELYNVSATNIVKVELIQQETCCGTNKSVLISIKQ